MIISDTHRYLFIEIPLTASYAIRQELCTYYDGTPILHKHAAYPEFLRVARPEQKDYFVFATVRNPLDVAVSRYFKLKMDHKGAFSDPLAPRDLRVDYSDQKKYGFVQREGNTFAEYVRAYHRRPFTSMISLSSARTDFVIRYESLQEGFSDVLHQLGIEQVRPVQLVNPTQSKTRDWQSYYTAEIIELAKRSFGPFMMEWGYEFPAGWGGYQGTWLAARHYDLLKTVGGFYLLHFRYSQSLGARLVRRLRALVR